MPFTKIPPSLPPRGTRRDWRDRLTLPNRLDLYAHGLCERRIATYGFVVWDVGDNRIIMEHGRLITEGEEATQLLADHRALTEGVWWLTREQLQRRRILAFTDSTTVYERLARRRPTSGGREPAFVSDTQQATAHCPHLTVELISPHENSRAAQLAVNAYVAAQEARRQRRASEVLSDLRPAQPGSYMVGDRYKVDLAAGTCTCPDFRQMHTQQYPIRCKHLLAAIVLEKKQSKR